MPVQSKIIEELPSDYGYVLLVGVGSGLLNIWLSGNVARGRKQYNVQVSDQTNGDLRRIPGSILGRPSSSEV